MKAVSSALRSSADISRLPQKNTFVTVGDLAASAQLVSLMSRWSIPFLLRSAEDVSMGDLRSTPTVLIGGFNNRWTLETMNDLPFAFRDGRYADAPTMARLR